jgi:hypothetical protein
LLPGDGGRFLEEVEVEFGADLERQADLSEFTGETLEVRTTAERVGAAVVVDETPEAMAEVLVSTIR